MLARPAGSLAEPRPVREKPGRRHLEPGTCQLSSDPGCSLREVIHPLCSAWQSHEKQQKLPLG